jgi:nickel/cobalt transporter (NiCoT) family protein
MSDTWRSELCTVLCCIRNLACRPLNADDIRAAGMCLLDTTDGALMMTLYTSTSLARDTIAILYYSIVLTAITVAVAACIGVIQLLTLVLNVASPTGAFWDGVSNAGDHYDIVGGAICGTFVLSGIASVLIYKPWRRRIDQRRTIVSVEIAELQVIDKEMMD